MDPGMGESRFAQGICVINFGRSMHYGRLMAFTVPMLHVLLCLCLFMMSSHMDAGLGLVNETTANRTQAESSKRTCIFPFPSWDSHTENMSRISLWKSKWRRAKSFQARPSRSSKPPPSCQVNTSLVPIPQTSIQTICALTDKRHLLQTTNF